MTDGTDAEAYLAKAAESLASAEADPAAGRFNSSANRAYYACFQAAVAALIHFGLHVADPRPAPGHDATQALFARELVQRRKVFPAELRRTLPELIGIRHAADYWATGVSEREAARALARARGFVEAVRTEVAR
jgi:uncharacterized protein (UPF0332 family)